MHRSVYTPGVCPSVLIITALIIQPTTTTIGEQLIFYVLSDLLVVLVDVTSTRFVATLASSVLTLRISCVAPRTVCYFRLRGMSTVEKGAR